MLLRAVLLVVLCLASALALPSSLGFYPGRSADIVVQSESNTVQDSVILFKGNQFSTTELNELDDTTFADLFAHVMGTQPFHVDADRSGFPTSSLFNKPKASAIIVIDSVGAETLKQHNTLNLLRNAHAASIKSQFIPSNTHTLLATIATGTTPSKHGIVGPSWRRAVSGEQIEAYSAEGLSVAANIADILIQETRGQSLIVSASASSSFASALAVHPELLADNLGYRAHAYFVNEDGALQTKYSDPSCDQAFALDADELAALVSDMTVPSGNVQVTFSTKTPEDRALLAELALIKHIIATLSSNAALSSSVQDDVPDMYSFVFSSLKGIQARYGEQSDEFNAALALVDEAADALLSALNALYDQRVATAVIALNAHDTFPESVKQIVHNKVARILYDEEDFATYFPVIYVRTNDFVGYARDVMCDSLQKAVDKSATVLCVSPFLPVRGLRGLRADTNGSNNTGNSSSSESSSEFNPYDGEYDDPVWTFWLNFFITIIITSFVLWGVYCLFFVGSDASKDSLLFRATGRHQHQN